ncbi:MAG: hypothetical protein EPO02_07395 [Nitrospirae bacterium]|nr:MAG: hypothetical protein EPO02_07395 [Nitrospirota bacterium]
MAGDQTEKHLLAGQDERERGFSRAVEIERQEGVSRAIFRYETLALESAGAGSTAALAEMVRVLQERGYRQLRTRLIFRDGAYLGSQELWVEYADPEQPVEAAGGLAGLVRRIRRALTRRL